VTGKRLNRVVLDSEFVTRFGASYRVIHRGDLLSTLLRACEAQDAIAIETATLVQSFSDSGTSVEVQTRKGARTGSALIGADGIRSAVRGQLLDDGPPEDAGHAIARALIPAADMPLKDNAVCLWLIPGGHMVHYPVRGGEMYNLVVAWDGDWSEVGWSAKATAVEVEAVTAKAVRQVQDVLRAAPSWRKWSAADRPPGEKWGEGRVTLLGDAAHAVLPYLAQGAVMALEDAVVLAKELGTQPTTEETLRAYEAARQPRLEQMHEMCRKAGMAYHATGGFRMMRNLILCTMSGKASRNRVGWIYDWRL